MKMLKTLPIILCLFFINTLNAQKIIDENIGFYHGGSSFFKFKRNIVETDNNLLIAKDNIIKSYDKTGELDVSFGEEGILEINPVSKFEIRGIFLHEGNLVIIATRNDHSLLKQFVYDRHGQELKSSYEIETPFRHDFFDVLLQQDGKVLLVGTITDESFNHFYFAMRLTLQGTIDNTLQMQFPEKENNIINNHRLTTVIQRDDGKLLIAGSEFDEVNLRLFNLDGTIDSSFGEDGSVLINATSGSSAPIQNIHLLDEKILVTGSVRNPLFNNGQYFFVSRLLANGQPDVTFANNGIAIHANDESGIKTEQLQTSIIQEDGKILLIGNRVRDEHANLRQGLLVKYNENGSLDESFMSQGSYDLKTINNVDIIHVLPKENGYDLIFTGIEDEDLRDVPAEFSRLFITELVTEFSTSTNELGNNVSFEIFPNPVSDNISIKYQLTNIEEVKMELFDITGKFITNLLEEKQTGGSYVENFNLAHIPKGSYFLFFTTSNNRKIIKLIK